MKMVVRKMKEKCKDAARMRREKERAEFVELSKLLPLPASITSQLDKASIIKLTSSYLRMRAAFPEGLGANWGSTTKLQQQRTSEQARRHTYQAGQQHVRELGSLILQTLDGFVFALHRDGKIMYVSETASVHLGLPQIDLTGSSIFDYVHPSDHNDIHEILALSTVDKMKLEAREAGQLDAELGRSFCMRMKCILPKRNAGLVNSGYKAIHCNGYLKVRQSNDDGHTWESCALVAVGHSLLPTASTELKLNGNSFMFRANLDLKLYYIEASVINLLGFEQIDMAGQSLYQFVHLADIVELERSHRSLLVKGQVVTKYYRLMRKYGGFVWVQSYATLVNNPRNMPKPQHIVSFCYVLAENHLDQSSILRQTKHQDPMLSSDSARSASRSSQESDVFNHKIPSGQRKYHQRERQSLVSKRTRKQNETSHPQLRLTTITGNNAQHRTADQLECTSMLCNPSAKRYQCSTCFSTQPTTGHLHLDSYIGSMRRPSDDSCSIVSSVASTSVSSASSQQSSEFLNYSACENYLPSHEQLVHAQHQAQHSYLVEPSQDISIVVEPTGMLQYDHFPQQLNSMHRIDCHESMWMAPNSNRVAAEMHVFEEPHTNIEYSPTICNVNTNYLQNSSEWVAN